MDSNVSVIPTPARVSVADQLRMLATALDRIEDGGGLNEEITGRVISAAVVLKTDADEIETVPLGHQQDWLATVGLLTVAASMFTA